MDWYSRYVVAWSLSNTLDAGFCVEALEQALSKGKPEVFSTDQGGEAFIGLLERHQVSIGMDGRQGALHRQHLCRVGVAHGEVRRGVPESLLQRAGGQGGLDDYFRFCTLRPHQALDCRTRAEVFNQDALPSDEQ